MGHTLTRTGGVKASPDRDLCVISLQPLPQVTVVYLESSQIHPACSGNDGPVGGLLGALTELRDGRFLPVPGRLDRLGCRRSLDLLRRLGRRRALGCLGLLRLARRRRATAGALEK